MNKIAVHECQQKECQKKVVFLGEKTMKKLAIICAMAIVCFALAGIAQAQHPMGPYHIEPSISLSITPDEINIGDLAPPVSEVPAQLQAHITANCSYHVEASFTGFKHLNGVEYIPNEHISVLINNKDLPVDKGWISIISSIAGTPIGGIDVPVDLKFSFSGQGHTYLAGTYGGSLVLTIAPGP